MPIYARKPVTVEAIKFTYDGEGIKNLMKLCGEELKNYGKSRGIFEKGWAWIGSDRKIAVDGDFVVKEEDTIKVYKPDDFYRTYHLVSGE